jgi:hypothetical protein
MERSNGILRVLWDESSPSMVNEGRKVRENPSRISLMILEEERAIRSPSRSPRTRAFLSADRYVDAVEGAIL